MQRCTRLDKRVIRFEFCAEVDPFFQVRFARGQLATDGEVASPCFSSTRHVYFQLRLKVFGKEKPAFVFKPLLELYVHAVIDQIKEAEITTGFSNSGGQVLPILE